MRLFKPISQPLHQLDAKYFREDSVKYGFLFHLIDQLIITTSRQLVVLRKKHPEQDQRGRAERYVLYLVLLAYCIIAVGTANFVGGAIMYRLSPTQSRPILQVGIGLAYFILVLAFANYKIKSHWVRDRYIPKRRVFTGPWKTTLGLGISILLLATLCFNSPAISGRISAEVFAALMVCEFFLAFLVIPAIDQLSFDLRKSWLCLKLRSLAKRRIQAAQRTFQSFYAYTQALRAWHQLQGRKGPIHLELSPYIEAAIRFFKGSAPSLEDVDGLSQQEDTSSSDLLLEGPDLEEE